MPIGVAVVGLGEIGTLHARNLAHEVPGARLRLVADQAEDVASAVGSELDVCWSSSLDDALDDPQVEAVVIATPSPLHAQMTERAALAGRHVFCEKPLALEPDAGRRAARAAEDVGGSLQIGFQRRFDAGWLELKRMLDRGDVGDVQLIRISHRNRLHPHGPEGAARLGTLFVDMSIHDFDSARWLVGEVTEVSAIAAPAGEGDVDNAVIALRFAGGALGLIDNARATRYGFDCAVEVVGRSATLRLGSPPWTGGVERLTPAGAVRRLAADHIEWHRDAYLAQLRHFVESIAAGRRPAVGADDALAALELSLAAERSHRCRQR